MTPRTQRLSVLVATALTAGVVLASAANAATFEDSGPIANGAGNPPDGPGLSVLDSPDNLLGFGAQMAVNNRVADDFTVTDTSGWAISGFELFAYQTGSTTTSTITEVNLRIWNGVPDLTPHDTGSMVVFGDTTTNRLVASTFSGVYRVASATPSDTSRPIMRLTAAAATTLPAGTYWLDVQYAGSLASGPWQPPVVLPGDPALGNALQSQAGSAWQSMLDNTGQKRVPFKVLGAPETTITLATVSGNSVKLDHTGIPAARSTGFECRVDGAAFTACPASSATFTNLTAGAHTIQVRSLIGAEADPSPAAQVVTITKPLLALTGKSSQKLGSKVKLTADCDRACTTTVSGKFKAVSGSGGTVSIELKAAVVQVAADGTSKVRLRLTRAAREAAEAALDDGGKVTVKVKGSAKDSAGNASPKVKRVVTLV